MNRQRVAITLGAVGVLMLGGIAAEAFAAKRLQWLGKEYFLLGANYPFYNGLRGLDIGRLSPRKEIVFFSHPAEGGRRNNPLAFPPIPPGGTGFDAAGIEKQLADMHHIGIRVVRWMWGWDGRDFFDLDEQGHCRGMSADVFTHLDQILKMAEKHRIYLMPVLLDFRFVTGDAPRFPERRLRYRDGTTEPPHGDVIRDPRKRRMLIENCIKPLVQRYKDSDQIIIWEIMNEAGNIANGKDDQTGYIIRAGRKFSEKQTIQIKILQEFFNEVYDAIKSVDQKHYVLSSGLARPTQLPMLVGRVKADLYGAHYNDDGISDYGKVMSVEKIQEQILSRYRLQLDKPLLMTESTAEMKSHLDYYIDAAYQGGWAGILVWTYYRLIGYHEFNHYKEVITSQDNRGAENVQFFRNWQKQHQAETDIGR
jgi:hypothetical protein